jgi:hypothetical protein
MEYPHWIIWDETWDEWIITHCKARVRFVGPAHPKYGLDGQGGSMH